MGSATDPRVDDYINSLPQWQQQVCREVREIVHAADPEIAETIKRTQLPAYGLPSRQPSARRRG
jgi:hypothetical protein